jgi:hypothetical protein
MVARRMGEDISWLHWLWTRRELRVAARFLGFDIKPHFPQPGEALSALSGYRFIITDTYHLCVNAWRMGIPAICVASGAVKSSTSLEDKKKEVLFETYGARDFYVFHEDLFSIKGFLSSLGNVVKALNNHALSDCVCNTIKAHKVMARQRLKRALRNALKIVAQPLVIPFCFGFIVSAVL